jgi:protein ImuB
MGLFAPRLERLDPAGPGGHGGVEVAVLAIPSVAAFTAEQGMMPRLDAPAARPSERARTRRFEPSPNIAALADRLAGRLGAANVLALGLRESHWPERAATAHPILDGGPPQETSPCAGLARPLRLFGRPEPIEVTAEAAATSPPAAFRWRALTHRIARSQGPERIEPEWWRGRPALARDYYRVEDRQGRRFWLYRELAGAAPRWFLHGTFA